MSKLRKIGSLEVSIVGIGSGIAGASTPAQVKANAAAPNWKLTASELAALDTIAPAKPTRARRTG